MKPIHVSHPSSFKTLESYADFYVLEQRGWRIKLNHTGSVKADQLARLLASEVDVQTLLHLAGRSASDLGDQIPEIDIRSVVREKPFCYSIVATA